MSQQHAGPFSGKENADPEVEARRLHHLDFGSVERTVRALIGLPFAAAFFYERHFSIVTAILFLIFGCYMLFTAIWHYCAFRHLAFWLRWKAFK